MSSANSHFEIDLTPKPEEKKSCLSCKKMQYGLAIFSIFASLTAIAIYEPFKIPFDSFLFIAVGQQIILIAFFVLPTIASYKMIRAYCDSDKKYSDILIIGLVIGFIGFIGLNTLLYFEPIIIEEWAIRNADPELREQMVYDLSCKTFLSGYNTWGDHYGIDIPDGDGWYDTLYFENQKTMNKYGGCLVE